MLANLCFSAYFTKAQVSINSSGGGAIGNGGSVAYSVGQVFFDATSGNGGTINSGVQQAFEIFSVSVENERYNLTFNSFPNPVTEKLTLQISNIHNEQLYYHITNLEGKLLSSNPIYGSETQIQFGFFSAGVYLLHVVNVDKTKLKTFKIVKNH